MEAKDRRQVRQTDFRPEWMGGKKTPPLLVIEKGIARLLRYLPLRKTPTSS